MYHKNMKTRINETDLFKSYFVFLQNLDVAEKLKLISQLSASMIEDNEKEDSRKDNLNKAFGSLKINMSTEEFIDDIRKSRYFDPDKKIDL